jgi:hypothetical protein
VSASSNSGQPHETPGVHQPAWRRGGLVAASCKGAAGRRCRWSGFSALHPQNCLRAKCAHSGNLFRERDNAQVRSSEQIIGLLHRSADAST